MIVVSNTSPLIGLALAQSLDLLKALFGTVFIPEEVYDEVVTQGLGRPGDAEVTQAVKDGWIHVNQVVNEKAIEHLMKQFQIERGESEAIQLAVELQADELMLEELAARRCVQQVYSQAKLARAGGIVVVAKIRGIIPEAKSRLDRLLNEKHITQKVYDALLQTARENP